MWNFYYKNPNNNVFTMDIQPDKSMKGVPAKMQDNGGPKYVMQV